MSSNGESAVLRAATRLYRSLFLFCALVIVLYLLGNFQEFLDEDQLMLLKVVRATSLAGTLLGGYCLGFRALRAILGSPIGARPLALDVLLFVANATVLLGVELLRAWIQVPIA